MARKSETVQKLPGISRVSNHKRGYDVEQVDAFLDRAHAMYDSDTMTLTLHDIQNAAFELVDGGYSIGQVDAALARLGRAVADKQTQQELASQGQQAWQQQTNKMYALVAVHANRAVKERFARGERKKPSYDCKQVDRLVDMVLDKLSDDMGIDEPDKKRAKKLSTITATSVSNSIFTQRKGARGYDERQVDYYLSYCVSLLNRLESYGRIAGEGTVSAAAPVSVPPAAPAAPQTSMNDFSMGSAPAGDTALVNGDADSRHAVSPLFDDNASFVHSHVDSSNLHDEPLSFAPTVDYAAGLSGEQTAEYEAPAASTASAVKPGDNKTSFDDVHKAEEAIFMDRSASTQPVFPVARQQSAPAPAPVPTRVDQNDIMTFPPVVDESDMMQSRGVAVPQAHETEPQEATESDSSLAALAHMASQSKSQPQADVPTFSPTMPSLDAPSVDDLGIPSVTFPTIDDDDTDSEQRR